MDPLLNNPIMDPLLNNLIDRYLYPDQIIFGHLFNSNIKSLHNYQLSKSTSQLLQNDQLIIYQKQMSKTKIDSMIQMMSGNHPPLFKSSILPRQKHYQKYSNSSGQEEYSQQEENYQDYDDQMYLMEKDYQGYFDQEYDQQENPIMAFGQNIGALPKAKNYAKDFNYQPSINKKSLKAQHHKFTKSQQIASLTQPGLGTSLLATQKSQQKQQENKNKQENQSDEQWQTESDQEQQVEFQDYTQK